MKITRFAQSCLLIETKGKRILIDPGYIFFEDSLLKEYRHDIDILLITHAHDDHCHVPAVLDIVSNPQTRFYAPSKVVEVYKELSPDILLVGDVLKLEGLSIKVVEAVHGFLPHLKGEGNREGVGYSIDDGEKKLYIVGDAICFPTNEKCDILHVPVCNHGLVMGPFDAARFAQQVEAKLTIPCHYDNEKYPMDVKVVEEEFKKQNIVYKILAYKESIEV